MLDRLVIVLARQPEDVLGGIQPAIGAQDQGHDRDAPRQRRDCTLEPSDERRGDVHEERDAGCGHGTMGDARPAQVARPQLCQGDFGVRAVCGDDAAFEAAGDVRDRRSPPVALDRHEDAQRTLTERTKREWWDQTLDDSPDRPCLVERLHADEREQRRKDLGLHRSDRLEDVDGFFVCSVQRLGQEWRSRDGRAYELVVPADEVDLCLTEHFVPQAESDPVRTRRDVLLHRVDRLHRVIRGLETLDLDHSLGLLGGRADAGGVGEAFEAAPHRWEVLHGGRSRAAGRDWCRRWCPDPDDRRFLFTRVDPQRVGRRVAERARDVEAVDERRDRDGFAVRVWRPGRAFHDVAALA